MPKAPNLPAHVRNAIALDKASSNKTLKVLAQEWQVTYDQVKQAVSHQDTVQLVRWYQHQLMERLVSKALAAVEQRLDQGDARLAIQVLQGVGVLGTDKTPRLMPGEEVVSLQAYRHVRDSLKTVTGHAEKHAV